MKVSRNNLTKSFQIHTLVIPIGNKILKLFSPHARIRLVMEWDGNNAAQVDPLWRDLVVPLHRIPFGFIMRRGQPATKENITQIMNILIEKYDILEKSRNNICAIDFIDIALLKELKNYGLIQGKIDDMLELLSNCNLPLSSSHGDLHIDNVIFVKEDFYFIDWSLYKKQSTIIFDMMHLIIRQMCKDKNISWTKAIFLENEEYMKISKYVDLDMHLLRMLYALDRASREIEQDGGLKKSCPEKYLNVIMKLTNIS